MTSGRMLPGERLDIDVEVLIDGTWWPGVLEHRRQDSDGQWLGFVRWTEGTGHEPDRLVPLRTAARGQAAGT